MASQSSPSKGKGFPWLLQADTTLPELPHDEKSHEGEMKLEHQSLEVHPRPLDITSSPPSGDTDLDEMPCFKPAKVHTSSLLPETDDGMNGRDMIEHAIYRNHTIRAPTPRGMRLKQESLEINKRPLTLSPLLMKTMEEKFKKPSEFREQHNKKMALEIKKHYLEFEKAFQAPSNKMDSNEESDSGMGQTVSSALSQTFANLNSTRHRDISEYYPINSTDLTNHMEMDRGALDANTSSLNKSQLQTRRDELEQEYTDMNLLQIAWLEAVEALSAKKSWKGMNEKQKSAYDRAIRFRARSTTPHPGSFWNRIEKYAARIFIVIKELQAAGISTESADLRNILSKAESAMNLPLEECRRMDRQVRKVKCLELECRGPCGKSQVFYQFSKDQRAEGTNWCMECVKSKEDQHHKLDFAPFSHGNTLQKTSGGTESVFSTEPDISDHKEKVESVIAWMDDTAKIVQEPRKLWGPEVAPEVMQELTEKHTSVRSAHSSDAPPGEYVLANDSLPDIKTTREEAMVDSEDVANVSTARRTSGLSDTHMKPTDTSPHSKNKLESQVFDISNNSSGVRAYPTHFHHLNANVSQRQSFGMANKNKTNLEEKHVDLANRSILHHLYSIQELEGMKGKEFVTGNTPMRECGPWDFAIENTLPCWNQAGFEGRFPLDGQIYTSITSPAVYQRLNDSGFSDKMLRALMTKSLQQQSVPIPLFPNNGEKWRYPRFILNGQLCERRAPAPVRKRIPLVPVERDSSSIGDAEWKTLAEPEPFSLPPAEPNLGNDQAAIENERTPSTFSHHVSDLYTKLESLQHSSAPKVPVKTDFRRTYESDLPHSPYQDTFPSLPSHVPSASLGIEAQNMMYEARQKVLASRALRKANERQTEEKNANNCNDMGAQNTERSPVTEALAHLEAHQKAIPTEVSPPPSGEQVNNFEVFDGYRASQYAKQRPMSSYYSRWEGIQKIMRERENNFQAPSSYFASQITERQPMSTFYAYWDEYRKAIHEKEERDRFDASYNNGPHSRNRTQSSFDYFSRSRVEDRSFQSRYMKDNFYSGLRGVHSALQSPDLRNHAVNNTNHVEHMPGTYISSPGRSECMTSSVGFGGLGERQSASVKRAGTEDEEFDGNAVQHQNESFCRRGCALRNLEKREREYIKQQEQNSANDQNLTETVNNDGAKAEIAQNEVAAINEGFVSTTPGELDGHTLILDVSKGEGMLQVQDPEVVVSGANSAQEADEEADEDDYDSDANSEDSWTMAEDEADEESEEAGEWEIL
ncbi:hypothetical protein OCU04_006575 [Sclerotinia nivalis]|uniref:Uncharacterized protein n=1 Tax=Sclerotinia nivalis TaxID=352851 RepID=A0A9X0AK29_9HELO|nr:hypothetical protein OCU04_006575 [Sclerotinia nivalis]